ncbi:MAG: hypothetical protein OEZ36_07620 [Spirochaetota bacterium]|nr:hypothetical protein [Spirochaetota bacterium]
MIQRLVAVDEKTHQKLKHICADKGISIKRYITSLVMNDQNNEGKAIENMKVTVE